jgi:hypothetical protein
MSTLILLVCLSGSAGLLAQDDDKNEQLPMPVLVSPELPMPVLVSPGYIYEPVSRYEVWQNYGVDRFGRFRPRVIYSPYGSFYARDGKPFPWVTTHPLEMMPYALD